MQVEKDIVVARDFIEGNVYEKTGYRPVKLFSDQSLKSFKKVKLKDNLVYQILYRIEKHVTPAGNKSKRKIYFIRKDDEELIFDDEVKKMFSAFKRPYIISGI